MATPTGRDNETPVARAQRKKNEEIKRKSDEAHAARAAARAQANSTPEKRMTEVEKNAANRAKRKDAAPQAEYEKRIAAAKAKTAQINAESARNWAKYGGDRTVRPHIYDADRKRIDREMRNQWP